jgi:hypothetical protein
MSDYGWIPIVICLLLFLCLLWYRETIKELKAVSQKAIREKLEAESRLSEIIKGRD